MPVERQGGLIMRETTIHQRVEGFVVLMIKMGIMEIFIKIEFAKTKELDYNKNVQTNNTQ